MGDNEIGVFVCIELREALTAFIESEAMVMKAAWEYKGYPEPEEDYADADWIKASWNKYLGREP